MTFDEWYENNKEVLTTLTFEGALKRTWIEAKVDCKTKPVATYKAPSICFSCGGPSHSFDCR